jgi:hypothetical protein
MEIIEKHGGVNSSMIYLIDYKYFCKCHNVATSSTTIKTIFKNCKENHFNTF